MAEKKKYPGLGADRDDDFGVWMAQRLGLADDKGRPLYETPPATSEQEERREFYRAETKKLIAKKGKKK